MNGINGTAGFVPAGTPVPTPAGYQTELNYIYGMVEQLSSQLAENRKTNEDIVSILGRVRQRAKAYTLGNDDLLGDAAHDITAQEADLDALLSLLSESLDKAKLGRDANAALLNQYAAAYAAMLKQFHEYKTRHVADMSAWHRSYRTQLAEARADNCRLREQVWEMQEHAGRVNSVLRDFRRRHEDDPARRHRHVSLTALRQEVRFWKRVAMPELPEDDPSWSDDDDLVDPVEKDRLRDAQRRVVEHVTRTEHVTRSEPVGRSLLFPLHDPPQPQGAVPDPPLRRVHPLVQLEPFQTVAAPINPPPVSSILPLSVPPATISSTSLMTGTDLQKGVPIAPPPVPPSMWVSSPSLIGPPG